MNIYFATKFANRLLMQCFIELLIQRHPFIVCTSRWVYHNALATVEDKANFDYEDIDNSKLMIVYGPIEFGASSEMGYAIAKGIPIIYLTDPLFLNGVTDPLPIGKLKHFNGSMSMVNHGYIVHNLHDVDKLISFYFNSNG